LAAEHVSHVVVVPVAFVSDHSETLWEINIETRSKAKELGINEDAANDIVYLRGRSRWTQEKEDYLVKLAKEGKPLPNIME